MLICILNSVLFLGGYLLDLSFISYIFYTILECISYSLELIVSLLNSLFYMLKASVNLDYSEVSHELALFYSRWPTYISYADNAKYYSISDISFIEGTVSGLALGIKSCIMIFIFIWVRASFPRIRFDQLMSFCWTILLPIIIAFIVLIPCVVISFEIIPTNISLL